MSATSIGTLAQSLMLRSHNARLRDDLLVATRELASGQKDNLIVALRGDFDAMSGIESDLRRTDSFLRNVSDQMLRYSAAQTAFSRLRESASGIGSALLSNTTSSDPNQLGSLAADAHARFQDAVATLNTAAAGGSLFAGAASDGPALADADTILSHLQAEIALAGAATAADVATVVDAWFAPGGGFDTQGYLGAPASAVAVPITDTQNVPQMITAGTSEVRDFLAGFALSALTGAGTLNGNSQEQATLLRASGERLLAADAKLVGLQADLGVQESRLNAAEVELKTQKDALQTARADLVGADPFETATRLQEVEGQLELLYSMTSRLSRLNLVDFLR